MFINYTKDNPLKVVTLCSGYDSQCMALDRIKELNHDFDYELVAWSEIDKYAIMAHNAVYPQWKERNLGDMTRIDWENFANDIDLLFYSTPCTIFPMRENRLVARKVLAPAVLFCGTQETLSKQRGLASALWRM